MKKSETEVPCSIAICANGCVVLRFGVAMIHLSPDEFSRFARAVGKMASRVGSHGNITDAGTAN